MAPQEVIDLTRSPSVDADARADAFRKIVIRVCKIVDIDFDTWPPKQYTPSKRIFPGDAIINDIRFLFFKDPQNLETCLAIAERQIFHKPEDFRRQIATLVENRTGRSREQSVQSVQSPDFLQRVRAAARPQTSYEATLVRKESRNVEVRSVVKLEGAQTERHAKQGAQAPALSNRLKRLSADFPIDLTDPSIETKPAKRRRTVDSDDNSVAANDQANAQLLRESQFTEESLSQFETDLIVEWPIRRLPELGFDVEEDLYFSKPLLFGWELLRARQSFPEYIQQLDKTHSINRLNEQLRHWMSIEQRDYTLSSLSVQDHARHTTPVLTAALTSSGRANARLLKLSLNPVKKDTSCRLVRKYGWERFMYVDVDLRNTIPAHLRVKKHLAEIRRYFLKWLKRKKILLGREWRAFHLEGHKASSPKSKKYQWRVVFFAVAGFSLDHVAIHQLIEFMLPIKYNCEQPVCKAYSRFDLALSRTKATFCFRPDQIRFVPDLMPTPDEQDPYRDATYFNEHREIRIPKQEAMTDGCAVISVGAAKLVNENLGLVYRPALFQARIAGAKGVWHVSADYDTQDRHHLDVWIEIRDSQLKVKHRSGAHKGRLSNGLSRSFTDDGTLTSFDVVKHSRPPKVAELHRDFLHIMEDRGVPRQRILDMAKDDIDLDTDRWIAAITDPAACARLIHHHIKEPTISAADELPLNPGSAERLHYFMRRGGFRPDDVRFMADEFIRLFSEVRLRSVEDFRVPCSSTTQLYGIADPTQTLPPGKVHIRLSRALSGDDGDSHVVLAGKPILIARDPTLRQSDIQKMDVVDWPALAHLNDCIVFSSRGCMPAAAKLQGGDYDGDIFWICWKSELTQDFKNAPVLESKSIAELGIQQDTVKLQDLSNRSRSSRRFADRFLEHAFAFRLMPDYLGQVTNKFYALMHHSADLGSRTALDLVDMHDMLVDAAKNGYTFERYYTFLRENDLSELEEPSYKTDIKLLESSLDRNGHDKLVNFVPLEIAAAVNTHILHDLWYKILFERAKLDARKIATLLENVPAQDQDLLWLNDSLEMQGQDQLRAALIKETCPKIDHVVHEWCGLARKFTNSRITEIVTHYKDIQPPASMMWLSFKTSPLGYTNWDYVKASLLAAKVRKTKAVFTLAKGPLCYLKSNSDRGREALDAIARCLRVQRPKVRSSDGLAALVSFTTGVESDTDDDYGSIFDIDDLQAVT